MFYSIFSLPYFRQSIHDISYARYFAVGESPAEICLGVPCATILPPLFTTFGSHVDNIVGAFQYIKIVFNYKHSVPFVNKSVQNS